MAIQLNIYNLINFIKRAYPLTEWIGSFILLHVCREFDWVGIVAGRAELQFKAA